MLRAYLAKRFGGHTVGREQHPREQTQRRSPYRRPRDRTRFAPATKTWRTIMRATNADADQVLGQSAARVSHRATWARPA